MTFEFDLPRIIKVGNESNETISTIETAAKALGQHMLDLQGALQGTQMQMPARFDNWQSVLNSISGDFQSVQERITAIVREAEAMLADSGS